MHGVYLVNTHTEVRSKKARSRAWARLPLVLYSTGAFGFMARRPRTLELSTMTDIASKLARDRYGRIRAEKRRVATSSELMCTGKAFHSFNGTKLWSNLWSNYGIIFQKLCGLIMLAWNTRGNLAGNRSRAGVCLRDCWFSKIEKVIGF